jgi:hypothetical protein
MKQRRSVEETAVILAVIFKRSGLGEARMSDQTIRMVSGRKRLEGSFRQNLKDELGEYGLEIVRFDAGDQALIRVSALEAASTVTATETLKLEEMEAIRAGDSLDLKQLLNELGEDGQDTVEEETPERPAHQDVRYTESGAAAQT